MNSDIWTPIRCPFTFNSETPSGIACLLDGCALWNKTYKCCAFNAIVSCLASLTLPSNGGAYG